jgi:hypothetical protein
MRKAEGLPVCLVYFVYLVYLVYLVQGNIRHYLGT